MVLRSAVLLGPQMLVSVGTCVGAACPPAVSGLSCCRAAPVGGSAPENGCGVWLLGAVGGLSSGWLSGLEEAQEERGSWWAMPTDVNR